MTILVNNRERSSKSNCVNESPPKELGSKPGDICTAYKTLRIDHSLKTYKLFVEPDPGVTQKIELLNNPSAIDSVYIDAVVWPSP